MLMRIATFACVLAVFSTVEMVFRGMQIKRTKNQTCGRMTGAEMIRHVSDKVVGAFRWAKRG